jgi:membrane protease YdiL (CAAX protease family)
MGFPQWRPTAPLRVSGPWIGIGVLGGLATFGVGHAYVALLAGSPGEAPPSGAALLSAILLTAVLPAAVEEWLCRGVLWHALRDRLGPWPLILVTAAMFSFLHGLNGAFVYELPHRFFAGLVFGWLRWRSGSIVPGAAAHFVNNVLATVVP